jgi:hypothetical protein
MPSRAKWSGQVFGGDCCNAAMVESFVEQLNNGPNMDPAGITFGNYVTQRLNLDTVQFPIEEGVQLHETSIKELLRRFMEDCVVEMGRELNQPQKDIIQLEREIKQAEDDMFRREREFDRAEKDVVALRQMIADLEGDSQTEKIL